MNKARNEKAAADLAEILVEQKKEHLSVTQKFSQ